MPSGNYEYAIETCYEAVAFPELWPKALDLLAHSLGATGAMFYPKDVNQNATKVPSSSVYSELLEDYVAGQWYENHYRAIRGWSLLSQGKSVVIEHDLATDEERKKLPHYNELYLRWGFPGFAAIGFHIDGDPWCLPLLRTHKEGFFTPEEAANFSELQPHLTRMMKLAGLFDHSRNLNSLEAFDGTGHAAILVGRNGRIDLMNRRAENLLARNAGSMQVNAGLLSAAHANSNRDLQALISAAVSGRTSPANSPEAKPVYVARLGRTPIMVEAVSLPYLVRTVSTTAQAILLLTDPEEDRMPELARLVQGLGLTGAEARLCQKLATGMSLAEAAEALGIAEGTARQHIKTVFLKTDTHRQGQLMLLLSRL